MVKTGHPGTTGKSNPHPGHHPNKVIPHKGSKSGCSKPGILGLIFWPLFVGGILGLGALFSKKLWFVAGVSGAVTSKTGSIGNIAKRGIKTELTIAKWAFIIGAVIGFIIWLILEFTCHGVKKVKHKDVITDKTKKSKKSKTKKS